MARPADVLRFLLVAAVIVAALFGSAGRLDLPLFWAYLGVFAANMVVAARVIDPDLTRERMRPGAGGLDRRLRLLVMPFFIGHFVVAGLDVGRLHFSDTVPLGVRLTALVALAASLALATWAVSVNPFFSPVVRIQSERGHRLVTGGPYRLVRHPGYLGSLVMCLASGLVLGSWSAAALMIPPAALLLRRTAIEDAFLRRELDGYEAFAQRVRSRLVPGVW